jgi:hypothetical protein
MTFRTYPESEQVLLTTEIRARAKQHRTTPLYLWRTALEQINPEVLPMAPYCLDGSLIEVYDLLNLATS